jgi:hypothetical protein
VLFFGIYSAVIFAGGIQVYSYQDDLGQIIVTDSLKKIPEKFRGIARKEFIPSFNRQQTKQIEPLPVIEPGEEFLDEITFDSKPSSTIPQIVEPPPEDESQQIASASQIIDGLKQVQLDNERMHVLSRTFSAQHPPIAALHRRNVDRMQKIQRKLAALDWKKAKTWKSNIKQLMERMKTLQYTISKWISEGGTGIKNGLPPLLEKTKLHLNKAEKELQLLMKPKP